MIAWRGSPPPPAALTPRWFPIKLELESNWRMWLQLPPVMRSLFMSCFVRPLILPRRQLLMQGFIQRTTLLLSWSCSRASLVWMLAFWPSPLGGLDWCLTYRVNWEFKQTGWWLFIHVTKCIRAGFSVCSRKLRCWKSSRPDGELLHHCKCYCDERPPPLHASVSIHCHLLHNPRYVDRYSSVHIFSPMMQFLSAANIIGSLSGKLNPQDQEIPTQLTLLFHLEVSAVTLILYCSAP